MGNDFLTFKIHKLRLAFLMLFLGALTYYLFRPSIILFDMLKIPTQTIFTKNDSNILIQFCRNHLSDIFWSLFINFSALWMNEKKIPIIVLYTEKRKEWLIIEVVAVNC